MIRRGPIAYVLHGPWSCSLHWSLVDAERARRAAVAEAPERLRDWYEGRHHIARRDGRRISARSLAAARRAIARADAAGPPWLRWQPAHP